MLPDNYAGSFRVNSRRDNRQIQCSVIGKWSWTDVATADTDGYSASHAGADGASTTEMTLGGVLAKKPDVPRNVVITVTHASSVVAMSGVITGTDWTGKTITEAWSVTATGTSKTYTGKKAFASITSITEVVAADASDNTIIAGTGNVLGLKVKASTSKLLDEQMDSASASSGTLVQGAGPGSSTADEWGTYTPNTAPNGSHDYAAWFICDDPWNS